MSRLGSNPFVSNEEFSFIFVRLQCLSFFRSGRGRLPHLERLRAFGVSGEEDRWEEDTNISVVFVIRSKRRIYLGGGMRGRISPIPYSQFLPYLCSDDILPKYNDIRVNHLVRE